MSKIAIIDIGTNSVLYMLVQQNKENDIQILHQETKTTRLGHTLHLDRKIHSESLQNTIYILNKYEIKSRQQDVSQSIAVGTHAFRVAANADEAIHQIKTETNIDVKVLSPDEEAYLSSQGALYQRNLSYPLMAVDVGGGSTEITIYKNASDHTSKSLELGAVSVSEKYLRSDPIKQQELKTTVLHIRKTLSSLTNANKNMFQNCILIGGTATTLAALELQLNHYDPNLVDGFEITPNILDKWIDIFSPLRLSNKKKRLFFDPNRADIFLPGILILREILNTFTLSRILISERGLRYGVALRSFGLLDT